MYRSETNTLTSVFRYLQTQLTFMDKCDIVCGWRDTNLRTRIDEFVAKGFNPLLERAFVSNPRQTLVHGDLGKAPSTQYKNERGISAERGHC